MFYYEWWIDCYNWEVVYGWILYMVKISDILNMDW